MPPQAPRSIQRGLPRGQKGRYARIPAPWIHRDRRCIRSARPEARYARKDPLEMDCWQLPAHSRIRLIILGIVFGGADTRQGFLDLRDLVRQQVVKTIYDLVNLALGLAQAGRILLFRLSRRTLRQFRQPRFVGRGGRRGSGGSSPLPPDTRSCLRPKGHPALGSPCGQAILSADEFITANKNNASGEIRKVVLSFEHRPPGQRRTREPS